MSLIALAATLLAAGCGGGGGNSDLTADGVPTTPQNVIAVATPGRVTLSWKSSLGASYYEIQRLIDAPGQSSIVLGRASRPTYVDLTASPGTTYNYIINADGPHGTASAIVTVTAK